MRDDRFSKEDNNEVINEITRHLEAGLREKSVGCVDKNVEPFSNKRHFISFDGGTFCVGGVSKLQGMFGIISNPRITVDRLIGRARNLPERRRPLIGVEDKADVQ